MSKGSVQRCDGHISTASAYKLELCQQRVTTPQGNRLCVAQPASSMFQPCAIYRHRRGHLSYTGQTGSDGQDTPDILLVAKIRNCFVCSKQTTSQCDWAHLRHFPPLCFAQLQWHSSTDALLDGTAMIRGAPNNARQARITHLT